MPAKNADISPSKWVIISAIGLIFFLGAAVLLIFFNERVGYIKPQIYYFLLVIIALACSAFLSGAMRSRAKYTGSAFNGTLELGGAAVIFVLIIYMGYKFKPEPPDPTPAFFSLKFTVFGSDSKAELIDNGLLKLLLNKPDSQKIENGLASFEIESKYRGREISVIPLVAGYYLKDQQVKIPVDDSPVEIHLQKRPDFVTVSGTVINKRGQPVSNAVILFENGIAKDTSDQFGIFRITLPYKDGKEMGIKVYTGNNKLVYNNMQTLSEITSMTLQISQ
jgi:hypothetical protein